LKFVRRSQGEKPKGSPRRSPKFLSLGKETCNEECLWNRLFSLGDILSIPHKIDLTEPGAFNDQYAVIIAMPQLCELLKYYESLEPRG
jgi:hypothetical protein